MYTLLPVQKKKGFDLEKREIKARCGHDVIIKTHAASEYVMSDMILIGGRVESEREKKTRSDQISSFLIHDINIISGIQIYRSCIIMVIMN